MAMEFSIPLPPEYLAKAVALGIQPADVTERFVRGGGKGGQKINKTSSCVVVKHIPTGIEVRCQEYREQSKNRVAAYKLLILKIEDKVRGAASARAQEIFKLIKQKRKRSKRAKNKMLVIKKQRGEIKALRRPPEY